MSLPNEILLERRRPILRREFERMVEADVFGESRAGASIRLHAFPDVDVRVSDVLR